MRVLWNQGYTMHKKSHNVLNYTMHIEMSMLEEWWWTKASIVTLNTSTFPILETLNPFYFLVSHLCNGLVGLLLWSLHTLFSDLNWVTMRAKVEFVYNVLNFVRKCIWLLSHGEENVKWHATLITKPFDDVIPPSKNISSFRFSFQAWEIHF